MTVRPGAFLKNIALFFFGFLPVAAIANMALTAALGDRVHTSPDWDIGWDPILWFIITAPWLVPTVVIVPVLYFLAREIGRRGDRVMARRALLVASPVLFPAGVLALYGPENSSWDFTLPVAVAGLVFGALQRIPD